MMAPDTMLAPSRERVWQHTPASLKRRIREDIEDRVHYYADRRHLIGERLAELDREWDIERAIETNAATLALTGLVLGRTVHPNFRILSYLVTSFLLQHGIQGWCPPVPVLRRLGFRTVREIETERTALRILRGDFSAAGTGTRVPAEVALDAVELRP